MSIYGVHLSGIQLTLLNNLQRANADEALHALRLSTGKLINTPKDDPAAFVQLSSFESQLSLIKVTKRSIERASSVAATSQTAIDEIRTSLESIRDLLLEDEDLGLTGAERSANQLQIDAALTDITSAARTESDGRRYLDGSSNYLVTGRNASQVRSVQIYSARSDTISGSVTTAATQGSVTYTGAAGLVNSGAASFTLTGKRGSESFSVVNGEALTDVRDRINQQSHNTGIIASVAGNNLTFTTVDYGDDASIDVSVTAGTFSTAGTTTGTDAVVTINGQSISSQNIDGNRVEFNSNGLHASIEFVAGFTGTFSTMTIDDSQVGQFALSTDPNRLTSFSVDSLAASAFSGISGALSDLATGGTYSGLGSSTSQAIRIVDEALDRLTRIEGTVNGFADHTVDSASSLIANLQTNFEDAIDGFNQSSEDEENTLITMAQTLSENSASALSILQQQQQSMMNILQLIATNWSS